MNDKGQNAFEWLLLIAGGILVSSIVIALFVETSQKPAERWQEEWTCSKYAETGELINCREETKEESEMIITGGLDTNDTYYQPSCQDLGEEWTTNPFYGLICDHWDENNWQCTIFCERMWQETVCDRETKCVEQKPRKCLVTREKQCHDLLFPNTVECEWVEHRECDEAIE